MLQWIYDIYKYYYHYRYYYHYFVISLIINNEVCKSVNMLHKHIFGFHKSDFVKCKLLANLEETFIAGKNRMNSKKIISEAGVGRCSSK